MTVLSYLEQDFEEHIEQHLLNSGYHSRLPSEYDKEQCLIPAEVIKFIQTSQSREYEKLQTQLGTDTDSKIIYRLSNDLAKLGALHVLRKGFKTRGCHFKMAYFKPASGMNPEAQVFYYQNHFSIVRQLKYSKKNENSLDMGIFLNGIPIITAEIKNSLTGQFVEEAIKQYKGDRDPKEPLFKFKLCLVHFAIGSEKVFMTTRLQEDSTRFLPFNRDTENPINPMGHQTAYLWEDILQPDTLLDIIHNYLHVQKISEKYYDKESGSIKEREYEVFIFPRYHQLDAVRKILSAIREEGVSHDYLIQHSAGSGKSNSIAWLAHQLASFYQKPTDTDRLFDTIVVVTDRKVLDKQLQNTIKQFEQVQGVVKPIDKNSVQLKEALEKGKDIIITTLQKFPVVSKSMTDLKGKRFAVIIDEAHSSQTGEASKHLKKVLTASLEDAEKEDHVEFDLEDEIIKEINFRGKQPHISYFAFTATPKGKTLELFGRKDPGGQFKAFHIYSMRQAIEEKFILDVLENYTTFKRYFKLAKKVEGDKEYEKKKALRLLMSYVDLHPHEIDMKTRIMLEHFMDKTVLAIEGKGRAMVVTRSRLHAVRFYFSFKKIMSEKGLTFKPLVAFSGTVKDPDTGEEHTETSLNGISSSQIVNAFKTPTYRILIVANKFQTGFDEPLLHTMYVDKKLGGVNAVQTLTRLNRTARGKTNPLILDFVNEVDEIKTAFQDYYQATFLEEETDPDKLHDLQSELEGYGLFTMAEVDAFAEIFFNFAIPKERFQPILNVVVKRWQALPDDNQREDFRSALQSYYRLYSYISQIITFKDVELEKLYVFVRNLNRKLPKRKGQLPYEIIDAIDLDSFRIQETFHEYGITLEKTDGETKGIKLGNPQHTPDEKDLLSNIVQALNDTFGIELTEDDKIDVGRVAEKYFNHEGLKAVMASNNTLENMRYKSDKVVDEVLLNFVDTKLELYKKLSEAKVNEMLKSKWFEGILRESLATGHNEPSQVRQQVHLLHQISQ
jgi:type I restriction enzyme R subunit